MDEGYGFTCGWWDIRSYEWPRVQSIVCAAMDVEHSGRWDIRFHGWPTIQCAGKFDAMDMVNHMVVVCGRRPGSYHVDSDRIQ